MWLRSAVDGVGVGHFGGKARMQPGCIELSVPLQRKLKQNAI